MTNKTQEKPLIMLTAGGTGGHVFPAESLAEELSKRGFDLALMTDSRGKDNYHGKLSEITNYSVLSGALVGKSKLFKIKSLIKTCLGIVQAGFILLKRKPVCVVGFGGYASFPCCMAAVLLGIDLVVHEQNSVMSRTNRFLGKYATFIATSFANTKFVPSRTPQILTGMPIRQAIAALSRQDYHPTDEQGKFNLLIIGGSQGAKIFGEVIPAAVRLLPQETQARLNIFHQCRKDEVEAVKTAYGDSKATLTVSHFFENMAELYAKTGLIISRAGASSMAEITAAHLPSILVPLPTAADDHQTGNAAAVGQSKAGIVMAQKNFTAENLSEALQRLLVDDKELTIMADRAARLSIVDASKRLADAIDKEIVSAN